MICYERLYRLGVKVNCLFFSQHISICVLITVLKNILHQNASIVDKLMHPSWCEHIYIYLVSFIVTRPHARGWPAAPKYILF